MKAGRASATARIIAASAIYLAHDRRLASLVPLEARAWSQRFLSTTWGIVCWPGVLPML